jgi:hypothetical protein
LPHVLMGRGFLGGIDCLGTEKERSVVMVSLQNKRKYKRMSTLQGKLRRRSKGGQFSYRLIVASGIRGHKLSGRFNRYTSTPIIRIAIGVVIVSIKYFFLY